MEGLSSQTLNNKTPTWLVFAAQLYVDARTTLRTKSTQPCSDLVGFSLDARRVLRGHAKFDAKHVLVGYQSLTSQKWPDVAQEIETWALKDEMYHILNTKMSVKKQRLGNLKTNAKKTREWQPYEILKMDPTLVGRWKYCFSLQLQSEGIRLVNETQVMVVAHLYNALKQNGYLLEDCEWIDAEYLLDIHAKANTFLGERPKTIEDCTKRLALAQGVSPQTFAAGRRRGQGPRVLYSKSGGRILDRGTPVASAFVNRFLLDGKTETCLVDLEAILAKRLDARIKLRDTRPKAGKSSKRSASRE